MIVKNEFYPHFIKLTKIILVDIGLNFLVTCIVIFIATTL
jgi:hypothetical protein